MYYSGRPAAALQSAPVDPQLDAVIGDLESAEQRLRHLRETLACDGWHRRPDASQWSPAECVAHLNLTSRALVPVLRAGLEHTAGRPIRPGSRYRRDPIGWLIWKLMPPSGGLKTRTGQAFVPSDAVTPPDALITEFEQLQSDVIACVRAADGLPIDRVKVVSPFDARVRYNLFAALTMVPRHQHRHLLQAERAGRVAPLAAYSGLVARPWRV